MLEAYRHTFPYTPCEFPNNLTVEQKAKYYRFREEIDGLRQMLNGEGLMQSE